MEAGLQLVPLRYIVLKIVEFQSGDDFRWALGRCNSCGLETPLGVLLDLIISTDSGGMLTNPCEILYRKHECDRGLDSDVRHLSQAQLPAELSLAFSRRGVHNIIICIHIAFFVPDMVYTYTNTLHILNENNLPLGQLSLGIHICGRTKVQLALERCHNKLKLNNLTLVMSKINKT